MPIETFGGIGELNPSYPPTSDGLSGGDDHIRGIKAALKASFPNIDDPLTATSTKLNAAAALVDDGVSKLADAGAKFKTNTKDGFENPTAGKVTITAQDGATTPVKQTVVEITGADKKLKSNGPIQAVGAFQGGTGQLVPIGGTLIWWEDTLPAEGGYAWANGGKVNVTDCPVMASKAFWQARFTDGDTKIQLPDMREVAPVGNSVMGATAARGLIDNFTSTVLTTIAGVFGAAKHVLTTGQMPKHKHSNSLTDPGHDHDSPTTGIGGITVGPGPYGNGADSSTPYKTKKSFTGVTITNADAGNDEAHNNMQPSVVVNWIIRVG